MSLAPPSASLGFPRDQVRPPSEPVARPTPLPKRPKGRWFVGVLLLSFCAFAGNQVWETFFRYQAYGTVIGRTIQVPSPWNGVVQYLHVRRGDLVRQGQLLVTVDDLAIRQQIARVADDLTLAHANLEADAAKLKWQSAFSLDNSRGVVTLYYESLGTLLQEQAKLEDLNANLQRDRALVRRNAITREELDHSVFSQQGQQNKVAQLRHALTDLKNRAEQADRLLKSGSSLGAGLAANGADQLKPNLARIQSLLAEKHRLQELLAQGEVRAPTNGVVVQSTRFPGESCKAGETVLALLQEHSLQIVLYLPQEARTRLALGDELLLQVEPFAQRLPATLVRLGEEFESAPEHLKRHYREGQKLLPAYLQPDEATAAGMSLRVNEVVKLPGSLLNWGSWGGGA